MTDPMKDETIIKDLIGTQGSTESSRLYLVSDVKSGETEAVIEHTIRKRAPLKRLPELRQHYHELSVRSGRRVASIENLVSIAQGK